VDARAEALVNRDRCMIPIEDVGRCDRFWIAPEDYWKLLPCLLAMHEVSNAGAESPTTAPWWGVLPLARVAGAASA